MHLLLLLLLMLPSAACAEVSDKVPSVAALWLQAGALGSVALLAGWYRCLLGVVLLLFTCILAWSGLDMLADPGLGPALATEFSGRYAVAVYGSNALLLSLNIAGIVWGWWRVGLLGDRPRPNNSSKPTPLRGAA